MNFKIGICDDEISLCRELEEEILEFARQNGFKIDVEVWNTAESCCDDLAKMDIDVLFLDIELPGNNGVSVGKYIRDTISDNDMVIVFISHKSNYAMELFQVHPYDFLIKPIDKEKTHRILNQLITLFQTNNQKFEITYKNVTTSVLSHDIIYLRSINKYVVVYTKDKEYQYIGKLEEAKKRLPAKNFVSISKSYIINLYYLKSLKTDTVTMNDDTILNVSKSHRSAFRQAYMDYNMWGGVRNA